MLKTSDHPSLLDQARHHPRLGLGNGTAFGNFHQATQVVLAAFVMSVVLARGGHDLAVELVLGATFVQDGDRLGSLVAHHSTDEGAGVLFSGLSLRHFAAPFFFSARMVLARAMSLRVCFRPAGLLVFCGA